jgi:hypothetical protein
MKKILLVAAAIAVLGAGCFEATEPPKPEEQARTPFGEALENASGDFGEAATSVDATPPEEKRWDTTRIAPRHVTFAPPPGSWVYLAENTGQYYLVPGEAPAPGSPDPFEDVMKRQVASMYPVLRDESSFPNADRFMITMAQFACASGTTEADLVICLGEKKQVASGVSTGGLPYTAFALEAVRKQDQSPLGLRHFVMVWLGPASDHAVLITVTGTSRAGAIGLAESMLIE